MGIILEDTYDTSFAINSKNSNKNPTTGCLDIYKNSPDDQENFLKELICLGALNTGYIIKAFTMKTIQDNFESLIKYK